ncbi:DUF6884 domain-containing protein [Nocardia sp. NPDC051052]|uniref:DUF6884 domain-containing protein n=1 Tax=Nocardia sp. NPDC051052 TaxID=3364322 RepID=UPI00379BD874
MLDVHTLFVIPCAARKFNRRAAARDLYTSPNFRLNLRAAEAAATADAAYFGHLSAVVILSACHGLLPLDREIDPYDVRVGDGTAISDDALAEQLDAEYPGLQCITALLPLAYFRVLRAAVERLDRPLSLMDVFEGSTIGYQRRAAANLIRRP